MYLHNLRSKSLWEQCAGYAHLHSRQYETIPLSEYAKLLNRGRNGHRHFLRTSKVLPMKLAGEGAGGIRKGLKIFFPKTGVEVFNSSGNI